MKNMYYNYSQSLAEIESGYWDEGSGLAREGERFYCTIISGKTLSRNFFCVQNYKTLFKC